MQLWARGIAKCRVYRWLTALSIAVTCVLAPRLTADSGSFDSNGVTLHYTVEGAGEPVLLIHGFAINSASQWVLPGVTKTLAKEYRVITLDNRGHGKSDKPHNPEKYGMEMVRDAIRLLDHLEIRKAHIVGYSMGGLIALKLTTLYPDRLLSTTLGGMGLLRPAREPMLHALADSLEKGAGFAPLIIWLNPPGMPKPLARNVDLVDKFLRATNDVKAMAALIRASVDQSLDFADDELKGIAVPILVLVGDQDPFKLMVEPLNARVPALQVVVVKNADHFSTVFKPLFLEALLKHLKTSGGSTSRKYAESIFHSMSVVP